MYRFEKLENLIYGTLSPENIERIISFEKTKPKDKFDYYGRMIFSLSREIKKDFSNKIFNIGNEETAGFVQKHLDMLLYLSNYIQEKLKDESKEDLYSYSDKYDEKDIFKLLHRHLESLMSFIVNRYSAYLDTEIPVPVHLSENAAGELVAQLERLNEKWSGKVDSELMKLLKIQFGRIAEKKTTFRKMKYMRKLFNELLVLEGKCREEINTQKITDMLYRMNFNSGRFIKYLTNSITDRINRNERYLKRLEELYNTRLYYSQITVMSSPCYKPEMPPIHKKLKSWFDEMKNVLMYVIEIDQKGNNIELLKKMITDLSAEKICFLFRLMNDKGILYQETKTDIFRFIHRNIETSGKKEITEKSIKSKFYTTDKTVMKEVRRLLQEMIDAINGML